MGFDLTCILTGHGEGRLAIASLRSFWAAIDQARAAGLSVQPLLWLDLPDDATRNVFTTWARDGELREVAFGDQSMTRNDAVGAATGRLTAFLDADDLWTEDWLVAAETFLRGRPDTHIAHPAYNFFFESQATLYCQPDQEGPEFSADLLRVANYWDALCVCPTAIHREIPFQPRDIDKGWAYEDWAWNCETVAAGKIHKIVPDSVLFKRRQKQSQTMRASQSKALIRRHGLSGYDAPVFGPR